jgi:hypothetical protein
MPLGTKVHKLYEHLKEQGKSVESAARIAQWVTGKALATGKTPKHPTTPKGKKNKAQGK